MTNEKTNEKATEILFGSRHPFQIYMLIMCIVVGLPLLVGRVEATSINAQLPGWASLIWGLTLSVGALIAMTGIFLPNRVNGLLLEGIGLVSVGAAAVVYAAAIVVTLGTGGMIAGGIILGFGLSCIVRWFQINTALKTFVRRSGRW